MALLSPCFVACPLSRLLRKVKTQLLPELRLFRNLSRPLRFRRPFLQIFNRGSLSALALALAFWLCSSVGSGSGALWAVDIQYSSDKTIEGCSVVRLTVRPPVVHADNFRRIERVDSIPQGASINNQGFYRLSGPNVDGSDTVYVYFLYDPFADVLYFASTGIYTYQKRVLDFFVDSYVYKSFELVRNPPVQAVSSSGVLGSVLQKLQSWIVMGVGLGFAIGLPFVGFLWIRRLIFESSSSGSGFSTGSGSRSRSYRTAYADRLERESFELAREKEHRREREMGLR